MIYGHDKTIHRTKKVNVELDKHGKVVAVWFRCMPVPFDTTIVSKLRAEEMLKMSEVVNTTTELLAIDVEEKK